MSGDRKAKAKTPGGLGDRDAIKGWAARVDGPPLLGVGPRAGALPRSGETRH
jgi:hypothetical protein